MNTISIYEEGSPLIKNLSPKKACEVYRSLQLTHPSLAHYFVDQESGQQVGLPDLEPCLTIIPFIDDAGELIGFNVSFGIDGFAVVVINEDKSLTIDDWDYDCLHPSIVDEFDKYIFDAIKYNLSK